MQTSINRKTIKILILKTFLFYFFYSNLALAKSADTFFCYRPIAEVLEYYKNRDLTKKDKHQFTSFKDFIYNVEISDQHLLFLPFKNSKMKKMKAKFVKSYYLNLTGLKDRQGNNLKKTHVYDIFETEEKINFYYPYNKDTNLKIFFSIDQSLADLKKKSDKNYFMLQVLKISDQFPYSYLMSKREKTINEKVYPNLDNIDIVDIFSDPKRYFKNDFEVNKFFERYLCEN